MTTYIRVDGTLTAGTTLPTLTTGATDPDRLWTPAGLGPVGSPVGTWTDEIAGTTMTAGIACTVGTDPAGRRTFVTVGPDGDGTATINGYNGPGSGPMTVLLVMRDMAPIGVTLTLGGFVIGAAGAGWQLSYGSQILVHGGADATTGARCVIFRAAGTDSAIQVDRDAPGGPGPITYNTNTTGTPKLGRTTAYAPGSHISALAVWHRALTDTEMAAVATQQKGNFPWLP